VGGVGVWGLRFQISGFEISRVKSQIWGFGIGIEGYSSCRLHDGRGRGLVEARPGRARLRMTLELLQYIGRRAGSEREKTEFRNTFQPRKGRRLYRGTSLIRNRTLLGPYRSLCLGS
jgi:hypothetical protein